MNRKGVWVLAAILIVAAGCAPKADAPEDVATIKAMVTAYGLAATAGDVTAVSSQYTDDAVRLEPNAPMLVGKEAIRSGWQRFLDQYRQEEMDVAEDVRIVGDLAFARGTYTAKSTPKVPGAAVIDDKGKWLTAYRRQPGGTWKIVVDMWNTDMPLAQVLSPAGADEQALLQIERDWAMAWLKQDAAALDAILADGYVENEQGATTTKAQMIAAFKAGIYKVESEVFSDMRVVVFGDQAVVNGIAASKQTKQGKDSSGMVRYTDVFEKRDGRWRAVTTYLVKIE